MERMVTLTAVACALLAGPAWAQDTRGTGRTSGGDTSSWKLQDPSAPSPVYRSSFDGAFATYAPVYRRPGPTSYTYPHGATVWYGQSIIPVSPPVQSPPAPYAGSPTPIVIHVHQGRGAHRH